MVAMQIRKLSVKDLDLKGRRVLMRVDFNVSLDEEGKIRDDTRIKAALPTIKYILGEGASLILVSHLGRPGGKVVEELRLDPVARRLEELIGRPVLKMNECVGDRVRQTTQGTKSGDIVLLENTRFHKEESQNNPEFARKLADLADLFVNDAFGAAHRAHASTVGVTRFLPAAAGFLMQRELEMLGELLTNPRSPFVAILGGAKISDKIGILHNFLKRCQDILVGGGMAYTFLKAEGAQVGKSLVEEEKVEEAREILKEASGEGCHIRLPLDHLVARKAKDGVGVRVVDQGEIPPDYLGLDIGPRTIELFSGIIREARTVFWNGPLGMFELASFSHGTRAIAELLAESHGTVIVGGGETVSAVRKLGIAARMTHVSTGGGASLSFLQGVELPGVAALMDKK
jgi:phosphoglycerate kinase